MSEICGGLLEVAEEGAVTATSTATKTITVSAPSGGNAEKALHAIAAGANARISLLYERIFGDWHFEPSSSAKECRGHICVPAEPSVPVVLAIGEGRGEIILKDVDGKEWCLRPSTKGYDIQIGSKIDQALIPGIANQIVLLIADMR
jgi:hypothetical protein